MCGVESTHGGVEASTCAVCGSGKGDMRLALSTTWLLSRDRAVYILWHTKGVLCGAVHAYAAARQRGAGGS